MNLGLEHVASGEYLEGSPPYVRVKGFPLVLSVHSAVVLGPDSVPGSQGEAAQLCLDPGGGLFDPPSKGMVETMSVARHWDEGCGAPRCVFGDCGSSG